MKEPQRQGSYPGNHPTQRTGISRAVILGTLLIPFNTYWIAQLEVVRYTHPTLILPFFNVIFILLMLTAFNGIGHRLTRKHLFTQRELVTLYVMLSVSSALASIDMMQILVSNIGHAFYFATPENEWRELFWDQLPRWLLVSDDAALAGYYRGNASLYADQHWRSWLGPSLAWLSFILVLLFMMWCICMMLRRPWIASEKLSYPIIRLPLEMTEESFAFFRNQRMWMGFALAATISLLNGLHYFHPALPEIPIKRQSISQFFTERPWNMMGGVRVSFYPFVIGVSFLIPLDLLLSCWVFYWIYKLELMVGGLVGFRSLQGFPYQSEQAFGAVAYIMLFVLWMGREHLKRVFRGALKGSEAQPADEPISYRWPVFGLMAGFAFLLFFSQRIGMPLFLVPLFFGLYFLVSLFITRMRAELGLSVHNLSGLEPRRLLLAGFGSKRLGKDALSVFALYGFFNRAYRSHPMPHQLEGFKMADSTGLDLRKLSFALLVSVIVTGMAVFWEYLYLYYRHGASSGYFGPWTLGLGQETFARLQNWIYYPTETDAAALGFMGVGFGVAGLLTLLRTRFLWFPLHPLGYAMAGDWGMYNLWSCFAVSFLLKWIILKYGGLRAYRRFVPFFLGLALGDLATGSLWSLLGIAMNTTIYQPFP